MSLSSVSILIDQETIPIEVEKFLVDISIEVERHRTKVPAGYRGFVPSDYRKLYFVLRLIERKCLTCGMKFCEWGSGIGVATMVASMVGFEAHGIEIDPAFSFFGGGLNIIELTGDADNDGRRFFGEDGGVGFWRFSDGSRDVFFSDYFVG